MCESINNDEKINVYFLKTDYTDDFIGFTKEQLLDVIKEDIENLEEDHIPLEFMVQMKVMTKSQYENLKEYEG